MIYIFSKKLVV